MSIELLKEKRDFDIVNFKRPRLKLIRDVYEIGSLTSYNEALDTEAQRKKLGFSTPFEFAVYEKLQSMRNDENASKKTVESIFGKVRVMNTEKNQPEHNIEFIDGKFIIKTRSSKESTNNTTTIKKRYEGWLMEKAQSLLQHEVEEYSEKLGVKPKKINIKNLKLSISTKK
jgi:predicted metal-dependent hydrolase